MVLDLLLHPLTIDPLLFDPLEVNEVDRPVGGEDRVLVQPDIVEVQSVIPSGRGFEPKGTWEEREERDGRAKERNSEREGLCLGVEPEPVEDVPNPDAERALGVLVDAHVRLYEPDLLYDRTSDHTEPVNRSDPLLERRMIVDYLDDRRDAKPLERCKIGPLGVRERNPSMLYFF